MIFSLFVFFTLIIIGLLGLGIVLRSPGLVLLAAIFMMLTGAGLMSEGIRDESKPTFFKAGDQIFVSDFNSFTQSNDYTVAMLAPSYLYGGFGALILSLAVIGWAWQHRGDSEDPWTARL